MFKYEEHINQASQYVLGKISEKNIIENFDELQSYCTGSKIMKNKLYQIREKGNIENYGIDQFKTMKNFCGEKLKLNITDDNKVEIIMTDKRKSIEHILRILNNEGAETILDGDPIFAEKKIKL